MKRIFDEMTPAEIKEFEKFFCRSEVLFSIWKGKDKQIRYTFLEPSKTTVIANKQVVTWLEEKGFRV